MSDQVGHDRMGKGDARSVAGMTIKKALPEQSFIENPMDFATIPSQGLHPLCSELKKDCSLSELL